METKTIDRQAQLEKELRAIQAQNDAETAELKEQEAERKFMRRPTCSVLGKGHGSETLTNLGISVNIPGNCGERYSPLPVTESVRIYMHNVWPYDIRRDFSQRLNEFVRKEVDQYFKDPRVVIELMGLNGFGAAITIKNEARRKKMMKAVRQEQFVVLDGLDQRKLAAVSIESLSHGRSVLMEYRDAGGKKRKPATR